VLVFFRAVVRKPDAVSRKEWYSMWAREAEASLAALEAGVIRSLYKVAGRHEVIGIMEFADGDALDAAVESLPLLAEGFSSAIEDIQFVPVRPYEHWAAHLKELSA
jgi:muconolactone delta-isomerase